MRQLRVMVINPDITDEESEQRYWLIQDLESHRYFVWRQASEAIAEEALETLLDSWNQDSEKRFIDLRTDFVDRIDRTLIWEPKLSEKEKADRLAIERIGEITL